MTGTERTNAPSPARVAALDRLARQAGRFPDLEFVDTGGAPAAGGVQLDARDAALARAIEHTVSHRWMSLAAIARACVDRRWENVDSRVQAALLGAGAQLFLFGNAAARRRTRASGATGTTCSRSRTAASCAWRRRSSRVTTCGGSRSR